MTFKEKLATALRPELRDKPGLSVTNKVIATLIIAGAVFAILETEPVIAAEWGAHLKWLEAAFFIVFLIEYIARIYSADVPAKDGTRISRIQYARTCWSLLDLLVLLSFVAALGESSVFLVRLLRLMRIVRLARLGRFSPAIDMLVEAVSARKYELFLTVVLALTFMVFGAGLLYAFEAEHQPEAFGSIMRSFWWAIATLTTVGYGDVTPITGLGKFAAGITAIFGVGLVAMPAGILAAAFSEAIQKRKDQD